MKLILAALVAVGTLAVGPPPADAAKKPRKPHVCRNCGPVVPGPYAYGYPQRYYRPTTPDDSYDCAVARTLDPGGLYRDLPCWAQRAFAPKMEN